MERFQDENKYLGDFNNQIFVKCPKCEGKAVVKLEYTDEYKKENYNAIIYHPIFECKQCFYKLNELIYQYVAYGNTHCSNCFEYYEFESQILNAEPQKNKAKCPHCNFQEELEPKIKQVLKNRRIFDGLRREQWYNFPLWFQKEFNGEVFWAYNLDHIDYLERYIKADLRERNNRGSGNGTMASRLLQFVKAAKNREKLLKILKKWKE